MNVQNIKIADNNLIIIFLEHKIDVFISRFIAAKYI